MKSVAPQIICALMTSARPMLCVHPNTLYPRASACYRQQQAHRPPSGRSIRLQHLPVDDHVLCTGSSVQRRSVSSPAAPHGRLDMFRSPSKIPICHPDFCMYVHLHLPPLNKPFPALETSARTSAWGILLTCSFESCKTYRKSALLPNVVPAMEQGGKETRLRDYCCG